MTSCQGATRSTSSRRTMPIASRSRARQLPRGGHCGRAAGGGKVEGADTGAWNPTKSASGSRRGTPATSSRSWSLKTRTGHPKKEVGTGGHHRRYPLLQQHPCPRWTPLHRQLPSRRAAAWTNPTTTPAVVACCPSP